MSRAAEMLAQFHAAIPDYDHAEVRARLHYEEAGELELALESGDRLAIARELADVVYVAYGTALVFGIDLDAALAAVHEANMAKLAMCPTCKGRGSLRSDMILVHGDGRERPVKSGYCEACNGTGKLAKLDRNGKVIRPAGWQPPNMEGVLRD